jgi:hypothetical protein
MTQQDKISMLRVLLRNDEGATDEVLNTLLVFAEAEILAWMYRSYPSLPDGVEGVPREYEMIQIHAVIIGYNMTGAEGQTSHSENGTVRQYAYSDMAAFIHKNVTSYAYIL